MKRVILRGRIGVIIGVLALGAGGCGDTQSGQAEPTTTVAKPSQEKSKRLACLTVSGLQTLGGESLAVQKTESKPDEQALMKIASNAFVPSMKSELNRIDRVVSADDPDLANEMTEAGEAGIAKVEDDPTILVDNQALNKAFAELRRLAEDNGYKVGGCQF